MMQCNFCANPEALVNYLFTSAPNLEGKPINELLICDKCVRARFKKLCDIEAGKAREIKANNYVTKKPHHEKN